MKTYRKDVVKDLGKRLKELRLEKGVTPDMLQKDNILTKYTISRVENGKVCPSLLTLVHYSIALDIPVTSILNGIEYLKYCGSIED